MPLMLTEVRVWNDDPEAYRLIIKDGTEIVGQTTIDPGLTGDTQANKAIIPAAATAVRIPPLRA